jgi:hypothetical protein
MMNEKIKKENGVKRKGKYVENLKMPIPLDLV